MDHTSKVEKISDQLKQFYKQNKKVRIYHGSTNSTRAVKLKPEEVIDVSSLNEVITIDQDEKIVWVEPNVPMDELLKHALKYNLMPSVVMEFPGITVGGAIQGAAGESSSFKFGLFHQTCLEYEMVLGDGRIMRVSPEKDEDLFWGTSGSYGTLGVITLVKLKLIPAKRFVQVTYERTNNFDHAISLLMETCNENVDFVDSLLFSENIGVVISGVLTDKPEHQVPYFSRALNPRA